MLVQMLMDTEPELFKDVCAGTKLGGGVLKYQDRRNCDAMRNVTHSIDEQGDVTCNVTLPLILVSRFFRKFNFNHRILGS